MADIEKVIYDIERCICHVPDVCRDCSHYGFDHSMECMESLLKDALELMKKQEAKEVEAEVINEIDRLYRCPSCHISMILRGQPYCHSCGQKVKW